MTLNDAGSRAIRSMVMKKENKCNHRVECLLKPYNKDIISFQGGILGLVL